MLASVLVDWSASQMVRALLIIMHSAVMGLTVPIILSYWRVYAKRGGAVPLHVALVGLGLVCYVATAITAHIVLFDHGPTLIFLFAPMGATLTLTALSVMLLDLRKREAQMHLRRRVDDKAQDTVGYSGGADAQ